MTSPTVSGLPAAGESWRLSSARLLRTLDDLEAGVEIDSVAMVAPGADAAAEWVPAEAAGSSSGYAWVSGPELRVALVPFFPIPDGVPPSADLAALREFAGRRRTVAIVLLRLGAYAVGVAVDGELAVTKSDTRYVMGRHRKGGQSQRRFERNREKWVRELFDKACRDAAERFSAFEGAVDWLALGGDGQVLNSFMKRCDALRPLEAKLLPRRVAVERPNTRALERAGVELWSWRVYRAED